MLLHTVFSFQVRISWVSDCWLGLCYWPDNYHAVFLIGLAIKTKKGTREHECWYLHAEMNPSKRRKAIKAVLKTAQTRVLNMQSPHDMTSSSNAYTPPPKKVKSMCFFLHLTGLCLAECYWSLSMRNKENNYISKRYCQIRKHSYSRKKLYRVKSDCLNFCVKQLNLRFALQAKQVWSSIVVVVLCICRALKMWNLFFFLAQSP